MLSGAPFGPRPVLALPHLSSLPNEFDIAAARKRQYLLDLQNQAADNRRRKHDEKVRGQLPKRFFGASIRRGYTCPPGRPIPDFSTHPLAAMYVPGVPLPAEAARRLPQLCPSTASLGYRRRRSSVIAPDIAQ